MKSKPVIAYSMIAVVSVYVLIGVLPIVWIFITSLKPVAEITVNSYGLPHSPTLANYLLVMRVSYQTIGLSFDASPLVPAFLITLSVASLCVVLASGMGLAAAFGLSRYGTGGNFLPFWFLSFLFAPPIIFAFPLYLMFRALRMLDSIAGLVAANLIFNIPFATWIFYSTLKDIPEDIEEAAMLEGANGFRIFTRIVVPLLRPVVAAVCALIFIFVWGEYLFSVILMNTQKTLTVALAGFNTGQMILYTAIAAGIIVTIIPAVIVLLLFHKYLVTGLSFGAVKG